MPTIITINNITGSSPYYVYLCNSDQSTCIYISGITSGDLPFYFEPPPILSANDQYIVRVLDSNPCEIISNILDKPI